MSLVMTLIAGAPAAEDAISQIFGRLARELPLEAAPDWLAPGRACDLPLGDCDPGDAEAAARRAIGAAAVDVVVQPAAVRRKAVFIADLESTIIENEMLDELAEFIGMRQEMAEITRRTMNGELDFAASLTGRVALLRHLPAAVLDQAASRIRLMRGARVLIASLRKAGVFTALVSGGFRVFAEPIAAQLGFDRVIANHLDIANGVIAGTLQRPLIGPAEKREALLALVRERGLSAEDALAIGDGANDLPMLEAAGLGIAFHAKPAVAAASRWRLDHADLTGILYAQGYRAEEIVGDSGTIWPSPATFLPGNSL